MPPSTPATSATTSTPKRLPPSRPKATDPRPQTDPDIHRRPDVIKKAPEPDRCLFRTPHPTHPHGGRASTIATALLRAQNHIDV